MFNWTDRVYKGLHAYRNDLIVLMNLFWIYNIANEEKNTNWGLDYWSASGIMFALSILSR